MSDRAATLLLILGSTLLRLAWAATLEITNDEAYHWQYAEHPALSYFDHPPMMMWVMKLSIALFGGWVHPLSVRFGFVALFAGSCWMLFLWTRRWFGERAGFWAVVGLTVCHYFTAFGGTFALPDSPLLFFSLFTFWQLGEAICGERGLRSWLLVGVGFGGAMLSKYHAVLIPGSVVAFAAVTPGYRRLLLSPGPYVAVLIGLAMFSPVIVWNAEHEWASFRFQGGRAADSASTPIIHGGPLVWLVGPLLFLLPWVWFWLVVAAAPRVFRYRSVPSVERLILCLALFPLAFFFVAACRQPATLPHWPVIGYVPLFPLAGALWADLCRRRVWWFRPMIASWVLLEIVILAAVLLQAHFGVCQLPVLTVDETRQFSGWKSVGRELEDRGLLGEPGTFLATNCWDKSGQLAFATRNRQPVACFNSFDARGFAFWSRPQDHVGRTCLMVVIDEPHDGDTQREFRVFFERITLVAEFPMTRSGKPFRQVRCFRCENQRLPYPFDYTSRK